MKEMRNELFWARSVCLVATISVLNCQFLSGNELLRLLSPVVIAHRGASAVAPENTRVAIGEAIRMKAPVIEFDVRATSDGELVLFHDDDMERLVGRKGALESIPWNEFKSVDVGKWFGDGSFAGEKPIRLADAIRICLDGGAIPLIEHKTGPAVDYAEVLRELEVADRVIVQSFNWDFLTNLKKELPGLAMGALGSKNLSGEKLAELKALAPDWVGWKYQDLRSSDVGKIHELESRIALWTVNDPAVAKAWVAAGVDAIITDVPDKVAEALASGE